MKNLLIIVIFIMSTTIIANADRVVTLSWYPNTEPDLAGYRLYQKRDINSSYDFNNPIDDLTLSELTSIENPSVKVTLTEGGDYYWVLTAYDNEIPSLESQESNVVTVRYVNIPKNLKK